MPADYARIREENIARYGWDTAVLDLLGQLYSERTHFIFELIQNAEDAGATELAFDLSGDRLEVRHDGRPFTEADVRGVCGVASGGKAGDLTTIGKFGIGFKSVYAYTRSPRVYSGRECFRIENFVRPFPADPEGDRDTRFVFPFDHDEVSPEVAVAEIGAALAGLEPATLLFLRHITVIRAGGETITRETRETQPSQITLTKGRHAQEWLVWRRQIQAGQIQAGQIPAGHRVELAFRLSGGRIARCPASPLSVFLPTQKETFLGFLIQGPYRTTPARDNIGEHDPSNQALARETAALLADVLPGLRDRGLLTPDALDTLPTDATRFPPGSVFRPLFDAVRDAFRDQDLLPVAGGGHQAAPRVRLAAGQGLPDLLGPGELGELCQAGGPLYFAAANRVAAYLTSELGVGEVTAQDVVTRAGAGFLAARPDQWMRRFYAFLAAEPALWRAPRSDGERPGPARTRPIIRLEDGTQVAPFDDQGRPAVYLPRPGTAGSGFPAVRRALAQDRAVRPFLEALGLAVPDLVDEVLQVVLPRYEQLAVADLDTAQRDEDLECVVRALGEAGAARRQELLDTLTRTAFLIGENAATGEQRFRPPPGLYQRSKDLEIYFDANPDAWFAADGYGPWLVQLREIGVRDVVAVRARRPGLLGHVPLADEFARHERGIDGFDPDAEIDGLEFALRHPGHARSEFVWNTVLAPSRRLVAGIVEKSVRDEFVDATRETVTSAIGAAAGREAWLPAPDGTFRRPGELSLDDLPPAYAREEGLATALGMAQPVIATAARQLGLPAEVLWGLSARPDLVALIRRELGI